MRKILKQKEKGFTLVEVLVALTLFTFITLATIASLYSVNNSYRKVVAMRSVLDNLSFALESISRNIRTAEDIVCDGTLASGTNNCHFPNNPKNRISMKSTLRQNREIEFRLNTSTHQIEKRIKDGSWGDWIAMTSSDITVERLSFFVHNADNESAQPYVIMLVSGIASAYTGETTTFAVQTLISQRTDK